jgi:hypothetical protein
MLEASRGLRNYSVRALWSLTWKVGVHVEVLTVRSPGTPTTQQQSMVLTLGKTCYEEVEVRDRGECCGRGSLRQRGLAVVLALDNMAV